MMVQTTPPKPSEPVREYVAPPSRREDDRNYEYQAPYEYEDPDECEFQAPESETDIRKPAISNEKK
jgi:hypothetical protein